MNINNYINRINYGGDLTPNLKVLKDLQQAPSFKCAFREFRYTLW